MCMTYCTLLRSSILCDRWDANYGNKIYRWDVNSSTKFFVGTSIIATLSVERQLKLIAGAAVCFIAQYLLQLRFFAIVGTSICCIFYHNTFLQPLERQWLRGARPLFISLFKASSSKMSDALRVSEARYDITPSEGCKCHVFDEESF